MLTEAQINTNKETFIKLVKSITIEGANLDGILSFLESSDFFTAPASTQFHNSYAGGLCEHSLEVYHNLTALTDTFTITPKQYTEDTLKIVGLFHDIYKANFYEKYAKNVKEYSAAGKKFDELGRFDWVAKEAYAVKESDKRLLAGSRGFNAFLLVSSFIPLAHEEIVALVNHQSIKDDAEYTSDIGPILTKYNLTMYLHVADFISTYHSKNKPNE